MLYLLIFISFIVHIVIFIYIKTLNNRVLSAEALAKKQKEQKKEIEELLAVYLLEIREENETLVETLNNSTNTIQKKKDKSEVSQTVESNDGNNHTSTRSSSEDYSTVNQTASYQPPEIEEGEETFEPSLQAQVLSLYNNGDNIESIARKLNCGKTEVELLVKFQQKNS
ncbi:DUF6115 domain-containing protein [Paraliobacillus salinarum]|uniref:DUF6115 domain-containing protein n=1 Tax=Paraliobacillus salinarum TaxID=1158996 RepID=UPI0015F35E6E|nr:hypothetical protein [Paraliobacillus salinarum]